MTIRVLTESEITPEGHRLRAELAAECDALLVARREAREHEAADEDGDDGV